MFSCNAADLAPGFGIGTSLTLAYNQYKVAIMCAHAPTVRAPDLHVQILLLRF
jgi:hypothetical protein